MKLAWLTKLPPVGVPLRGDGSSTILPEFLPKTPPAFQTAVMPTAEPKGNFLTRILEKWSSRLMGRFAPQDELISTGHQPFLLTEQKRLKEQIETYAESPFETSLFTLRKKANDYVISKAWAVGIKSQDPVTREAALALLKAYLAYTGTDDSTQLSAHTQMKLMIFSPQLSEGPLGKAILYEALLSLPAHQLMEYLPALSKDFSSLPPIAQALLLKQLLAYWKGKDKSLSEDDNKAIKKLVKSLVIAFYSGQQEGPDPVLNQQEKIRLGFLKIQPIEDAYRKDLEELERRYRLKLRQLKKRRSQKIAEVEEERQRRIELVYDAVESSLMTGLKEFDIEMEEVLAV